MKENKINKNSTLKIEIAELIGIALALILIICLISWGVKAYKGKVSLSDILSLLDK